MDYTEYISNANISFAGVFFKVALDYAQKALRENPNGIEALICAGKACISLEPVDTKAQM